MNPNHSTGLVLKNWLAIGSESQPDLGEELQRAVNARIVAGQFPAGEVSYIAGLNRQLVSGKLDVDSQLLERLRKLCVLWEVEIQPSKITSHRALIGPIIVFLKKILFPIIRMLLKDTIRKQREFNAAVIELSTELASRSRKL